MNSQLPIALHIMGFLAFSRVLAKLKRAGLVQSRRGVGGGSVLARPADAVTLREVYEAITDDTKLMPPFSESCCGSVAPILGGYVNELFAEAEQALLAKLQAVTVAEMDRDVRQRILKAKHVGHPA